MTPVDCLLAAVPRILECGDAALSVEFASRNDPEANARVQALDRALTAAAPAGVIETVPTYRSLTVHVDPLVADVTALRAMILRLSPDLAATPRRGRTWRVPVVYGGSFGVDLEAVAAHCGLSPAQLMEAHSAGRYHIAMIGFLPGFAYLNGLDPALGVPRREVPRTLVPASSVSIGGVQAAVGSVEGPSGWHLIGRTPVRPFQREREPVFLFAPGDILLFAPVPAEAWEALDQKAAAGEPVAELLPES